MRDGAFLAQVALSAVMPFKDVACPPHFAVVVDDPWLRLLVHHDTPHIVSKQLVVLGKMFARDTMAPVPTLSSDECDRIAASGLQAVADRYWGNYVAFLCTPSPGGRVTVSVLRAPLGRLGCYWHQAGEKIALVSEPHLMVDAGLLSPRLDADAIAHHIAMPETAASRTCLMDLHALPGGHRLFANLPHPILDEIWSPWMACDDRPGVKDHNEAAARLREVLGRSLATQLVGANKALLLLSGGLDSSILAACLHSNGSDFHGLNLVTEAAVGDERHFARLAAQAAGADLTETFRAWEEVNLSNSRAARGARPYARAFTQATEQHATQCAELFGASIVLDGGGGDNLFFNYPTLAALVEVLRKDGPGRRFWRTSASFAQQADTSLASVVTQTIRRAAMRGNRLRFEQRTDYLSVSARTALTAMPPHPWYDPPKSIAAGKAAHVALLVPAQATAEQTIRFCGSLPWISPFICQPGVETVLGLPIWCWFAPGLNRAAARLAFRDVLPATLIERRTKGTPNSFVNCLFEKHRAEVRTMLLDGRLAGMGILDLDSLRKVLDDPAPARDLQFARIMELVDVEAWARSWD